MRRLGMGRARRSPRRDRGAVLAEFALVAPLLLMLLLGTVELGGAYTRAQAVEAAANEAGRLASLSSSSPADVSARVSATLGAFTGQPAPVVTISPGPCAGRQGETVAVTVSAPHHITIPFAFERDLTLTSTAVFRCEA